MTDPQMIDHAAAAAAKRMAQIEARHEGKAALLREMQADRVAQYVDQHGHIGVELAQGLTTPEARQLVYRSLARLSNTLAVAGYEAPGRLFASLARGIERGTHQTWGHAELVALQSLEAPLATEASTLDDLLNLLPAAPTPVVKSVSKALGTAWAQGPAPAPPTDSIEMMVPVDDVPRSQQSLEASGPYPDLTQSQFEMLTEAVGLAGSEGIVTLVDVVSEGDDGEVTQLSGMGGAIISSEGVTLPGGELAPLPDLAGALDDLGSLPGALPPAPPAFDLDELDLTNEPATVPVPSPEPRDTPQARAAATRRAAKRQS